MISVIGAGYVGSYTSHLLAKNGFKVNIYEEHNKIGKPIRDTGIVTSTLNNLIKIAAVKSFISVPMIIKNIKIKNLPIEWAAKNLRVRKLVANTTDRSAMTFTPKG